MVSIFGSLHTSSLFAGLLPAFGGFGRGCAGVLTPFWVVFRPYSAWIPCVRSTEEYVRFRNNYKTHYTAQSTIAQLKSPNLNVIGVQSEHRTVAAIERRHQRLAHVRVAEAQRVSELVRGHLKQIRSATGADRPQFGVVEVRVAAVHREVRMGQGAAGPVERIAVAVLALLESDLDVHRTRFLRGKRQIGVLAPHAERVEDLLVHLGARQPLRVLGDAVGQRLHLPAAALQGVALGPRVRAEAHLVLDAAARQRHQLHRGLVQFAGDIQAGEALKVADRLRPGAGVQQTAAGRIARRRR